MIEYIENSQALTSLFGEGFDLSEVDLHEVVVHRDGPSMRLRFDISCVPSTLPSRWPKEANTTQVVLLVFGIDKLQISGFTTQCQGTLRTLSDQDHQMIEFTGFQCALTCAFHMLRIERVSGYVIAPR
jgi:hypothetical protein